MISGEYLDATGSRRTSRGKGVTVFGGELVEWSSVHELAKEHQFNPGNTLYHSKAQEDLYMQLVHHSKREPLWVEWEGGRIEEFEIGSAKANSMIPALAREAMDLSAPLVKMMEKREQDRLVREYTQRWHRYVRSELNVVGIPLSIRWRTFIGRWLLRFGFTAALPPRP
jgi:nitrogenase molybdenum-iron protein alpha/beta subunit